jgi:hypothetical protein
MKAGAPLAAALAAALVSLAGCRKHASPEDCHAMTEHYLDLAVEETRTAAGVSPAESAAVREIELGLKRAEPSFRAVQDRCGEVTRAEVSCAMDSSSTKTWEGCLADGGR